MNIHINNPKIRRNLELFYKHGNPRLENLGAFNDDVKTLEKLFKSYGLSSFAVEVDDQGGGENVLEWDEGRSRIMWRLDAKYNELGRPLIEADFQTRLKAKKENWLSNFFEDAIEELRKANEADGVDDGPKWKMLQSKVRDCIDEETGFPDELFEKVQEALRSVLNPGDDALARPAMLNAMKEHMNLDQNEFMEFLLGEITFCSECDDWTFGDKCSDECAETMTAKQLLEAFDALLVESKSVPA